MSDRNNIIPRRLSVPIAAGVAVCCLVLAFVYNQPLIAASLAAIIFGLYVLADMLYALKNSPPKTRFKSVHSVIICMMTAAFIVFVVYNLIKNI